MSVHLGIAVKAIEKAIRHLSLINIEINPKRKKRSKSKSKRKKSKRNTYWLLIDKWDNSLKFNTIEVKNERITG